MSLCRELTKLHEATWRGTLGEAIARCESVEPRGEYVVVVEGAAPPAEVGDDELIDALDAALAAGTSRATPPLRSPNASAWHPTGSSGC